MWKVFIFQRVLGGLEPTKRFLFFGVFVTSLVLLPQGKTQREPDQEQESCSVAHHNLLQQRKWSEKTVSPLKMFYDARLSVLLYYILIQDRRMKSWIISVELLLSDSMTTHWQCHIIHVKILWKPTKVVFFINLQAHLPPRTSQMKILEQNQLVPSGRGVLWL